MPLGPVGPVGRVGPVGPARRLLAALSIACALMVLAASPAAAYVIDGPCRVSVYQMELTLANPKIKIFVHVECHPRQHTEVRVRLIESDQFDPGPNDGPPNEVLMSTDWKMRAIVSDEVEYHFKFNGNCDTEPYDEELVAKVRLRYREQTTDPWHVTAWDDLTYSASDYYC